MLKACRRACLGVHRPPRHPKRGVMHNPTRDALMRLLPATVGTRLQKAGSNRWTSKKCLTATDLANKWPAILMSASDQVYRCAISPFCDGGWRRASLSVGHFAIFLAIAPSPSPNLHRIARRIATDTLFAIYVGQWHDGVTDVSSTRIKLSTAPSFSDPMRGLDTLQGDLLCWRALLCPFKRHGPSKWVMGLHLWIWRRN